MNIFEFIKNNFGEDSTIFEIGCHMGLDTERILGITKSRNYHCFECDPRNVEIMKSRQLGVRLNAMAASDTDGKIDFYMSTGSPGVLFDEDILNRNDWTASSSLKKPKKHLEVTPWCGFSDPIEVTSTRIDTYCDQNSIVAIDFVWMDVQGAELEVLGGFGALKERTRFIYTEYSDVELYENGVASKQDLLNVLGSDWEIVHDFGNDVLIRNKKY